MFARSTATFLLAATALWGVFSVADPSAEKSKPTESAAEQLFQDGNFRDAYQLFRQLALDPHADPTRVGRFLEKGIECLTRLGRTDEVDDFRDAVLQVHSRNWRLLQAAAATFLRGPHHGVIVAGKFYRGSRRGGRRYVNVFELDRTRALQLMWKGLPLVEKQGRPVEKADYYEQFAEHVFAGRQGWRAWLLQRLTDLTVQVNYDEADRSSPPWAYGGVPGAPVDEKGRPVFYRVPESFEKVQSDGERWRWLLQQAAVADPSRADRLTLTFADFLWSQFGVQTLQTLGWVPRPVLDETGKLKETPYSVHTLADDETLARLKTGVRRFHLPKPFNFIRLYRQVADSSNDELAWRAVTRLATVYENRRQYPRAAAVWKQAAERFDGRRRKEAERRLKQIVGAWGRFEPARVQPAGRGPTVQFRFRNGHRLHLKAYRVRIDTLLDDVKNYLRSNPQRVDRQKLNLSNIGYRLVVRNETRYLGPLVADWTVDLEPAPNHFDRLTTLTTPLQKAGVYLLVGQLEGGNVSRILVWAADTVILRKPFDGGVYYYVADAVTGRPIPEANVEFFGYRLESVGRARYVVRTKNFAEFTDADGQLVLSADELPSRFQWVTIARTRDGRLAFLGFEGVWYARRSTPTYKQTRAFVVTDRPVYRPGQPVRFKVWVRDARYDLDEKASVYGGKPALVRMTNPKGETVYKKTFRLDEFGGAVGELSLDDEAPLGQYQVQVLLLPEGRAGAVGPGVSGVLGRLFGGRGQPKRPRPERLGRPVGWVTFRVEEYKKPEYEVTVEAPDEPVRLGETITATIRARYYFGAPVTHARVHYRVYRTGYTDQWYPVRPWDWLYGPGYWWSGYEYDWYPGWSRWGCLPPRPFWLPFWQPPPELVAEDDVPIGPDGTVRVTIDTSVAKELHPDQDHRYRIVAEVVDRSRRTVVGEGSVLVARRPFRVVVWVDRGFYQVGDTVRVSVSARTPDHKPVEGRGTLRLLKVTYDSNGCPNEQEVQRWPLQTDRQGQGQLSLKASQPGQYRLSYKLTDKKGHTEEGGYLFVVRGVGFDGSQFRFSSLELRPDKPEYAPGETVRLMVNTDRAGSTVLLFVRPADGVYSRPRVLRLKGKSTLVEIPVRSEDQPNFFVEGVTVSDGRVHVEVRQIPVPPEKRVLNVQVLPSRREYRPGEPAKVRVKVTDLHGRPFVGSLALTVYDKSVEYISGGSNVPAIREYFWKWVRHHRPQTRTNLDRWFHNLLKPNEPAMQGIGVFGWLEPVEQAFGMNAAVERRRKGGPMLGRGAALAPMAAPAAKAEAAAAPEADQAALVPSAPGEGQAELVQPTVRKEFADTAYWNGTLTTGPDGTVEVSWRMPENLTTWRIRTWAVGAGTRVGEGDAEVVTTKNLLVRLQAPRFFVETDEVVLSANVHNYLQDKKRAQVTLELEGGTLELLQPATREVVVAADDEVRVDWRVRVTASGRAVVRVKALTDEESDAVEMAFPVFVHGILKTESFSGVLRPEDRVARFTVRVPKQRRVKETRLEIRYSPTLAGALVDALPYLVNYPYGCTEQTLNRFLPTVLVQNLLRRMDVNLKEIRDKQTNLNPQEIGDDVQRAAQWKRYARNPVFDEEEVERMVKKGVQALTEMQLSDGGWGWFSGYGERSYPHTTALVVHGLQLARQNHVALVPGVLERGVQWLKRYQAEQVRRLKNAQTKTRPYKTHADNLDALVFQVLVDSDVVDQDMLEFLYRDRKHLSVYALALYGLALHRVGEQDKLAMVLRNIEQYLVEDPENQTAYLRLPNQGYWWFWYGNEIEADAYYLKLLSRVEPNSRKAAGLVKYLLNNRKHATYWNSTRDTAICIEALAEYLLASGEAQPDLTVEVWVDGKKVKQVHVDRSNLFHFDNKVVLEGARLAAGEHAVELRKTGSGPLYYNAYLTNFTKEDFITRAGLEIKVNRKYYRLVPVDKRTPVAGGRGQVVEQRVEKFRRVELKNLSELKSGELVEIELEIDSKNDYEYLVFEDRKAAGLEPVELRSGYVWSGLPAYVEYRDEKVVFFVRWLPRGKHSLSYRMRAEIPGRFSALPTLGYAMYAPELKANSDEIKLVVED